MSGNYFKDFPVVAYKFGNNEKAVRFFDHCIYDDLQTEMVTTNTHHSLMKLFKETLERSPTDDA